MRNGDYVSIRAAPVDRKAAKLGMPWIQKLRYFYYLVIVAELDYGRPHVKLDTFEVRLAAGGCCLQYGNVGGQVAEID